eukprot:8510551-Pyramimonas_sp.AAC.1
MAYHRSLLTPFDNKRCTGHRQHASVCNKDLAKAAQYIPKMPSLCVEAVQIADDMFAVSRDPFHDHPHASPVLVTNVRGFDLDDPPTCRRPDERIVQPPSGRWGFPACAGNVNMHCASHSSNPKHCRWYDN